MSDLILLISESIRKEFYKGGPSFGYPEAVAALSSLLEWLKENTDMHDAKTFMKIIEDELEKGKK